MSNKKKKIKKDEGHRIGSRIRARKVRVIDQSGKNLGVLWIRDALKKLKKQILIL